MSEIEPIEVTNLDIYGSPEIPWSRPRDLLEAGQGKSTVGGEGGCSQVVLAVDIGTGGQAARRWHRRTLDRRSGLVHIGRAVVEVTI
jgi:hypothetical protein